MSAGENDWLTEKFQQHAPHLRAVAYRMLGSLTEADDALQEAWLRVHGQEADSVDNMQAWLTTIVGRICLNMLRSRRVRREDTSEFHVPDLLVSFGDVANPADAALMADSVGLALQVVLDSLSPGERLAFVLHDVFGLSFSEIAQVLDRSEAAAQQLASRARRRVREAPEPDPDLARQRRIVDAFFAASRDGDFEALVRVLHPEVVLRVDGGHLRREASLVRHGADAVAEYSRTYSRLYRYVLPAVVNGAAGAVVARDGQPYSVMAFTITDHRIVAIDALVDPERLSLLSLDIPAT